MGRGQRELPPVSEEERVLAVGNIAADRSGDARNNAGRNDQAERVSRPHIDDQVELLRLLYR